MDKKRTFIKNRNLCMLFKNIILVSMLIVLFLITIIPNKFLFSQEESKIDKKEVCLCIKNAEYFLFGEAIANTQIIAEDDLIFNGYTVVSKHTKNGLKRMADIIVKLGDLFPFDEKLKEQIKDYKKAVGTGRIRVIIDKLSKLRNSISADKGKYGMFQYYFMKMGESIGKLNVISSVIANNKWGFESEQTKALIGTFKDILEEEMVEIEEIRSSFEECSENEFLNILSKIKEMSSLSCANWTQKDYWQISNLTKDIINLQNEIISKDKSGNELLKNFEYDFFPLERTR